VLSVGVEGDDELHRRVGHGVLETGLQRGALAEVDRVAHDPGAGLFGNLCRAVRGSVVDADDLGEGRANPGHDVADDLFLVVHGNDHPRVFHTRSHHFALPAV